MDSIRADSTRAYVDAPVRDLTAATLAARRAAEQLGLAEPELVRMGMNAIFRAGDVALRVSQPTVDAGVSLELARYWRRRGLAVPVPAREEVVEHADLSVTAWHWIEETTEAPDWEAVGAAIRSVHETPPATLPAGVPLPRGSSFPWWNFDALLARTAPLVDAPARDGLVAAVERHRGWDEVGDVVLCHGDVHPGNVMMTTRGPLVIDWDLLCLGPAGWDHGPMMTWETRWGGRRGDYDAFASGYGRSFVGDPAAEAVAELRLVAATLMRVIAAADDPRAVAEAERRLRYWRGDPDAPSWVAQ